jgi:hypothetical protein
MRPVTALVGIFFTSANAVAAAQPTETACEILVAPALAAKEWSLQVFRLNDCGGPMAFTDSSKHKNPLKVCWDSEGFQSSLLFDAGHDTYNPGLLMGSYSYWEISAFAEAGCKGEAIAGEYLLSK